MGVDLVSRLMFGVDVTDAQQGEPSFLDRTLQGEFGDFQPADPERPWSGIEEHMLDRLEGITVLEAVDHYEGISVGAVAGVVLAECHNRGEPLSGGLERHELHARTEAARRCLARHRIEDGTIWLTSYAG